MSPRPGLWPEVPEDRAGIGLSPRSAQYANALEQHVRDGLSPELALDLVLNELVVAVTAATGASAAALALARGQDLVCRATTGDHAPDLGIPLNAHVGFSGACIRSRQPQRCIDTETDEQVDAALARRLGIRSMLVVPILDGGEVAGIIEVFSSQPAAFSESHEIHLQSFALDCLKLQRLSLELAKQPPRVQEQGAADSPESSPENAVAVSSSDGTLELNSQESPQPVAPRGSDAAIEPASSQAIEPSSTSASRTDVGVLALTVLVMAAAVLLTFLIGFRTGWLRAVSGPTARKDAAPPSLSEPGHPARSEAALVPAAKSPAPAQPAIARPSPGASASDGLVIYERGKVVFRATPKARSGEDVKVSSANDSISRVWLAPDAAEALLRERVEPDYPADARAARRSGDVTLEVIVQNDGSVGSSRILSGDPLLADAAAAAVRAWRYEPYRLQGRPTEFQTEVTLKFSLSQ